MLEGRAVKQGEEAYKVVKAIRRQVCGMLSSSFVVFIVSFQFYFVFIAFVTLKDFTLLRCYTKIDRIWACNEDRCSKPIKCCRYVKVEHKNKKGRPRITRSQLVSNDFRKMELESELAQDCKVW